MIVISCCSSYYWFNPLAYIFVYISFSLVLPSPPTRTLFPSLSFIVLAAAGPRCVPSSSSTSCVFFPLPSPPRHSVALRPRAVSPVPAATMFWKFDLHTTSHIDQLLDREDVTLRELMEEDDVLQECKAQNRRLLLFLSQEHCMQELVSLITTEPPADLEERSRFK